MTRHIGTSQHGRAGGQLLALLLALLMAMVTLSSHGAMESHQVDCGIAAEWMPDGGYPDDGHSGDSQSAEHDHDASSCATCSTAMRQSELPALDPQRQSGSPDMAVFPQIPLTPRRPPRA
ncbi:DUF2946 family protein [Billgrantia montanilacus]|uniref:DUF2946 domain-containing protein n=1 Tax=Billgrantia montanilacus TaxID=2282305 RepID=A0A368TXT3_9GAMM|nr:DUF2946 family protein [Halomonas montanilacus]RCV89639.1 hypothetical protein DU505_08505 [Halomonas montanilacus]